MDRSMTRPGINFNYLLTNNWIHWHAQEFLTGKADSKNLIDFSLKLAFLVFERIRRTLFCIMVVKIF